MVKKNNIIKIQFKKNHFINLKINQKLILFFFIISLIFTSCTSINNTKNIGKKIYTGTEGVLIEVFSNLPDSIYEGEILNYIIKVVNKGPYEVNNAKLLITLEKNYMEFSDSSNIAEIKNINLEGKSLNNLIDDFSLIEKPIKAKKIDSQSEYQLTNILTSFCYDYKGILINDVCIDSDPYNLKSLKKVCNTHNLEFSEGQGGPLKISLIETRMLSENNYLRPQFKISFQNVGNGIVIKKGTIDKVCNKDSLQEVYNVITLKDISFSKFHINDFECYPEELILKQEQNSITCTLKPGLLSKEISTYSTPLRVEIEYGYFITDSKNIKIKKLLKY
ncbi:MAG: hypothetical protein QXE31_00885 [Candidatus Woesearchaeota archaeon]